MQRKGAAFHLSQLWRKGAWVIALSSDCSQLIVYSYSRVLGRLDCNCLFNVCLSKQPSNSQRARVRLCSSCFLEPDTILAQRRAWGSSAKASQPAGSVMLTLEGRHFGFLIEDRAEVLRDISA